VDRVYSHNGGDPLHRDNLPSWTTATALDSVDVAIILDFGGDRTRALREMAERFGLTKTEERKQLTKLMFAMIRQQASQNAIEVAAFAEGIRLGLSTVEVVSVATWVAEQAFSRGRAT
jgi:hypothetical protein